MIRIGFSKDIHRLVNNRELIICGVHIPYDLGEDAHSDGDVAYHAISEALLGSLALGDLGSHFPDTDERYKDVNSALILEKVYGFIKAKGFHLVNIDLLVSLERPKLKPYIESMRNNVAHILEVDVNAISIKAGTNENCDAVGLGQAIVAYATVLVEN